MEGSSATRRNTNTSLDSNAMVTPGADSLTNGSAESHPDIEAQHSDDEEHEEPSISLPVTIGLLVVVTVVCSITSLAN